MLGLPNIQSKTSPPTKTEGKSNHRNESKKDFAEILSQKNEGNKNSKDVPTDPSKVNGQKQEKPSSDVGSDQEKDELNKINLMGGEQINILFNPNLPTLNIRGQLGNDVGGGMEKECIQMDPDKFEGVIEGHEGLVKDGMVPEKNTVVLDRNLNLADGKNIKNDFSETKIKMKEESTKEGQLEKTSTGPNRVTLENDLNSKGITVARASEMAKNVNSGRTEDGPPKVEEEGVGQGHSLNPSQIKSQGQPMVTIPVNDRSSLLQNQIHEQVSEKIVANLEQGRTEFTMDLMPERLGKINIRLIFEAGRVLVHMEAQQSMTQNLLASSLSELKSVLQGNNLQITDLYIDQQMEEKPSENPNHKQGWQQDKEQDQRHKESLQDDENIDEQAILMDEDFNYTI